MFSVTLRRSNCMISSVMQLLTRTEHPVAVPVDIRTSPVAMEDTENIIMKAIWMICSEICSGMHFMEGRLDEVAEAVVCISEDLTGEII